MKNKERDLAGPEKEPKEVKGVKKTYTFPLKQRSVKATSLEEAINKIK